MVTLVIVGVVFLAFMVMVFKDLSDRSRSRRLADSPGHPASSVARALPVVPREEPGAHETRRTYVVAFWISVAASVLLRSPVGLPGGALLVLASVLFLGHATYRVTRLLGHDLAASALLVLVSLLPLASWIQYYAFSKRCRTAFGPLGGGPVDRSMGS